MIATSRTRRGSAPLAALRHRREQEMQALSAGSFVGGGSFRCQQCGYALTLDGSELLTACPSCGGTEFLRASMFKTERISGETSEQTTDAALVEPFTAEAAARLATAREQIEQPGEYLVYEDG